MLKGAAISALGTCNEHPRISGQGTAREVRRPGPRRPCRDERRRSGRGRRASFPGRLWVVKAQIHAGGRGKGKFKELGPDAKGGVRLARSIDEVRANAAEMLGKTLVTIQTGPAGQAGQPPLHHRRRRHRQGILSRSAGRPRQPAGSRSSPRPKAAWTSRRSPTTRPRRSSTITIDPATGLMPHHGRAVAAALGLKGDLAKQAAEGARQALRRLRRHRRLADRDQPAGGHRRGQAAGARRQGRLRQRTPSSATPTSSSCAT